jgi:Flp pilus assembly protein TadD
MSNFSLMIPVVLLALGLSPAFAADTAPDPTAVLEEARAAIDAGDYSGAMASLTEVVAADPQNADALNLLGYASRKSGDMANAATYYEAALAINPSHFGALEYQGEMFVMLDQMDAAKANLAKLEAECAPCEEFDDLSAAITDAGA